MAKKRNLLQYNDFVNKNVIDELFAYIENGTPHDLPYNKWDDMCLSQKWIKE